MRDNPRESSINPNYINEDHQYQGVPMSRGGTSSITNTRISFHNDGEVENPLDRSDPGNRHVKTF